MRYLIILMLCSVAFAATEEVYVDPDSVGGDGTTPALSGANAAFASLSAAEIEWDGTANAYDIININCASSSGTDDTTAVDFADWDDDVQINIISTDYTGVWDASAYTITTTNADCITVSEPNVYIEGIQAHATATGSSNARCIISASSVAPTILIVANCLLQGTSSSTGHNHGIESSTANRVYAYNTASWGHINGADSSHAGFFTTGASTYLYAWNCVSYGNYYGFYEYQGSLFAVNCVSGNNTGDDFETGVDVTYSCSDDGTGTNSQTPSGGSWPNELTNTATGDFNLVAGGNCIGNGDDDPGGANQPSTDIEGTTRTSPWDIGIFKYTASSSILTIINNHRRRNF